MTWILRCRTAGWQFFWGYVYIYRRKFRGQNFRQYGQMEKERWQESEKRKAEDTSSEKRKSQKKEDAGARKCRKVAKHSFFPMFCAPGLKSRLAKAAEPSGQMRDQKWHAAVARFGSQNAKNTSTSDHFWKLRWKIAHRCGAKHISK